jgi:hypothetical protein
MKILLAALFSLMILSANAQSSTVAKPTPPPKLLAASVNTTNQLSQDSSQQTKQLVREAAFYKAMYEQAKEAYSNSHSDTMSISSTIYGILSAVIGVLFGAQLFGSYLINKRQLKALDEKIDTQIAAVTNRLATQEEASINETLKTINQSNFIHAYIQAKSYIQQDKSKAFLPFVNCFDLIGDGTIVDKQVIEDFESIIPELPKLHRVEITYFNRVMNKPQISDTPYVQSLKNLMTEYFGFDASSSKLDFYRLK